jgi:hypothetical protein
VPDPRPLPFTEKDLQGWKLLERFIGVLDKYGSLIAPQARETHGLRLLDRNTYFGLFLFGLLNPVCCSMRALCAASKFQRVAAMFERGQALAISRFSDAQAVFSPEILQPVLGGLLAESLARQPEILRAGRITPELIHIFDSTVWKVVARMDWAEWRHQHKDQKAVRLHVKLRLCDLQPASLEITEGKICERAAMRRMLKPGEFYLGDRNYGSDHSLFAQLVEMGCRYVLRLRNECKWELIEEHPLSDKERAHGIVLDARVRLGHRGGGGETRIIVLRKERQKEDVILVTSEPVETLSAIEVCDLYRHRWQVEMFFRWLKCLVPCRHWFAESRDGVGIQIYLCLIKALLLAELTGNKPNKRMMELLQWHQMGMIDDEELARYLKAEEDARRRRAAKALEAKKR